MKPNHLAAKISKRLRGNQINWNQVFYFSEVAACGSIKDAALNLELSPSTLSEQISQLEKDLEVQLFYRHHRKLTLTPEGTRLFLHAKEMFEAGQRLIDVVSPIPLGCYPISTGLVPSPSIQLAYQILGDYLENFGPLDMKLFHSTYTDLEMGLSQAQLDFGFSDRISTRKDIVSHRLSHSSIQFFVSPRWSDYSFSDLLPKLPLLVCNADPTTRTLAEQALIDSELTPSSIVTSDYPSVLLELCQRGLGIGVFIEAPMNKMSVEAIHSLRIPPEAPNLQDSLYVQWSKDAENTEAVKRLKSLLPLEAALGSAIVK